MVVHLNRIANGIGMVKENTQDSLPGGFTPDCARCRPVRLVFTSALRCWCVAFAAALHVVFFPVGWGTDTAICSGGVEFVLGCPAKAVALVIIPVSLWTGEFLCTSGLSVLSDEYACRRRIKALHCPHLLLIVSLIGGLWAQGVWKWVGRSSVLCIPVSDRG